MKFSAVKKEKKLAQPRQVKYELKIWFQTYFDHGNNASKFTTTKMLT